MQAKIDQTPIDVVAALADSPYKGESKSLADEFTRVGINVKGMVHNAPLKIKTTFGADIYEVMRLIQAYEPPLSPKKKGVK